MLQSNQEHFFDPFFKSSNKELNAITMTLPSSKTKKSLTVIDLFCGCGGLSKGFADAGFQVLLGVDHDQAALETYKKNFSGAKAEPIDLFDAGFTKKIAKAIGQSSVDVIVAGPPCQGFSLTGTRNFDDDRNKLYLAVFDAVKALRPQAFVIENVKGMKTLYGGEVKDEILKRFRKLGYKVPEPKVLCAADFGVPQVRERLFFVGIRDDISESEFIYPDATHSDSNYVTCEQALSDLPSLEGQLGDENSTYITKPKSEYQRKMRANTKILANHTATKHTDLVIEVIKQVPEGGNHKDLPPGVGESRKFNEAWTRYHSQKPSRTIDTGHRNHFHYKFNRVPTIRENARLQSFPDDFVFLGNKTSQNRQVGNAVPPLLAEVLAHEIRKTLQGSDEKKSNKLKTIDLFAGCGGLSLGFQETNLYELMAHVEWEQAPIEAIREWLISQGEKESSEKLIHFDIQRLDELFNGWSGDPKYQNGAGLDKLVKSAGGVDVIIGGPPCQAYSIAGRVRDENGMHFDYRNYLFESYLEVVKRYQPKAFVFENVPGMLSAAPGGVSISERVTKAFNEAGYAIVSNLKDAVVDLWNYGVPQKRTRVIIIGLKKDHFTDHQKRLNDFYKKFLPSQAKPVISSQTALSDLPALLPLKKVENANGKKFSHSYPEGSISHHVPRFHSQRDIKIFQLLAKDLQKPKNKRQFQTVEDLKRLYTEQTGKTSAVHKYHVINPEEPSNTIPAHLYKDGLRHIHWDHKQARSLTVREAARLQTFPDLYKFGASQTDAYKMIGNAVPPAFARALALALYEVLSP